jgi:hypothetical protein
MRKDKYIELIQRNLSGGDVPADVKGKYHEKTVALYVELAYNKILWDVVQMSNQLKEWASLEKYTKSYIVTSILRDEVREQYYIETPVPLMELPFGEAVRYVGPADDESSGFIPRDPRATKVMAGLDVEIVDQTVRYQIEHDKIYFRLMENAPPRLMVKMIVPFGSFDDLDDIAMPGGLDSPVFAQVMKLVREGEIKSDVVNNEYPDNT